MAVCAAVAFWLCFSAAAAALAVTVAGSLGPLAALRFLSLADTAAAAGGVKTRMKLGWWLETLPPSVQLSR